MWAEGSNGGSMWRFFPDPFFPGRSFVVWPNILTQSGARRCLRLQNSKRAEGKYSEKILQLPHMSPCPTSKVKHTCMLQQQALRAPPGSLAHCGLSALLPHRRSRSHRSRQSCQAAAGPATPLLNAVLQHADRSAISYHVPGHKVGKS